MNTNKQEEKTIYKVVVNHEQQYSIWPTERENALGWYNASYSGSKEECLAYINKVWTEMRRLACRKQLRSQHVRHTRSFCRSRCTYRRWKISQQ
ncbi:MAG: MbtH family protein [Rhizonema sp. NSF051]|nr:MbtH family protein [Rhizonema sp. NSF051]